MQRLWRRFLLDTLAQTPPIVRKIAKLFLSGLILVLGVTSKVEAGELLQIAPVPGLTTAWHTAPAQIKIPLGSTTQLVLRSRIPANGVVEWVGASEVQQQDGWSIAERTLTAPGRVEVSVLHTRVSGASVEQNLVVEAVSLDPGVIDTSAIVAEVDPVEVEASDPATSTYPVFRDQSIADLEQVSPAHFRTSTERVVRLEATTEPVGFESLVEWRRPGRAPRLGGSIEVAHLHPRRESIEVGPTENPRWVTLETYRVTIAAVEGAATGEHPVVDGQPITLRASTQPPGFESRVRWLSSTLFGSAEPVLGRGAELTVTFDETLGKWPGGWGQQWLGVRADNAVLDQDQKLEVWTPFDPDFEFPTPPGLGEPTVETVDCLPEIRYDSATSSLVPRTGDFVPCAAERFCIRRADGTYEEVSEQVATQDGCDAFDSLDLSSLFDGSEPPLHATGNPAFFDDLEALGPGECFQVSLCPDDGDVPTSAQQTADPPTFTELEPLPPVAPTLPPNAVTILDNGTRLIPPCLWEPLQNFANRPWTPVPMFGDDPDQPTRIDSRPPNFVGLDDGTPCRNDGQCRSALCTLEPGGIEKTCTPKVRLSERVRTNTDDRVNPLYFRQRKGNDRWNVEVATGIYAANAHVQGVFYPSLAWDLEAAADLRVHATAAGKSFRDLVVMDYGLRNSYCSFASSRIIDVFGLAEDFSGFRLGANGVFVHSGLAAEESKATDSALESQCEAAFQRLRSLERSTNERLWDTFAAAALWNGFGPSPAVPTRAVADSYVTRYGDSVADYQDALGDYLRAQDQATRHALGAKLVDLDVILPLHRPAQVEHRLGPFVLGAEVGLTGKVGVDVLSKSLTNFSAGPGEADVALGLEIKPRADVRGYGALYFGVGLLGFGVEAGIEGDIGFASVQVPAVFSTALVRDEVPIDPGPMASCIPDALLETYLPTYEAFVTSGLPCPGNPGVTGLPIHGNLPLALQPPSGAFYRVPVGYNVGVQGQFLDGRISAFVRAKFFGFSKTWTKTLVDWQGQRRNYLTLADGADIFLDSSRVSFEVELPQFDFPLEVWIGPQRDMVYLPDMSTAIGPPGTLGTDPAFQDVFGFLVSGLLSPDDERWGLGSGLCALPSG